MAEKSTDSVDSDDDDDDDDLLRLARGVNGSKSVEVASRQKKTSPDHNQENIIQTSASVAVSSATSRQPQQGTAGLRRAEDRLRALLQERELFSGSHGARAPIHTPHTHANFLTQHAHSIIISIFAIL